MYTLFILNISQKCYEDNVMIVQSDAAANSQEVEVDIDELLDMDSDDIRRRHLTVSLLVYCSHVNKSTLHAYIHNLTFYL